MRYLFEFFTNKVLISGLAGWLIAQIVKLFVNLATTRKFDLKRLWGDGGMPSSHSATVTAVAVATGMTVGWDSPLFAVAAIMALVVMHDAMGVRQETGKQAKVINSMLELFESMGRGDLTPEETLKEFVGHTRRQVCVGALLGAAVAIIGNM